ncbi:MAG TPA: DUF1559 domain-containing protein, partial [Planctomycetaceae bacterium]|nr:DUF1559 domain-containing protein [Planctomycetaceae bacterium]
EWASTNWARWRGNYVINFGNTTYGQTTKAGVTFRGAPFSFRRSSNLTDIKDGTNSTLMLAEVIVVSDTGAAWGGPISEATHSTGGQTFEAWVTPNSRTFDDVARTCPPASALNGIPGCNLIGGTANVPDQSFAARSLHSGGVHVTMCDGSGRFINNTIALAVWRALSTSRGQEPVSEF